jgi:serine protease Do
MSATSLLIRNRLVHWLFLGVVLSTSPVSLAGEEGAAFEDRSFARVVMKHQYSGLMHGDKVIAQSTVVETSEFDGAVVDTHGYIVSFVGSYWSLLESPNSKFWVELSPGRTYPAELVGVDERVYVGVFKSEGAKGREIPFGSWAGKKKAIQLASRIGDKWGCTSLEILRWTEKTTLPEKELKGRLCDCSSRQHARVGSVALDEKGRLLGLVSQAKQAGFNSRIGSFHVVPVGILRDSVKQVVNQGGSIRAGWLGIIMNPDESEKVRISEVVSGSPADQGGLKVGDYLLKVNGAKIGSQMELVRTIRWAGSQAKVEFSVLRDGRPVNLTSVLGENLESKKRQFYWAVEIPKVWTPEEGPSEEKELKFYQVRASSAASFGFLLEPLNPQLAKYFKSPSEKGLLVESLVEGSAASKAGFRVGDVIFEVNDVQLGTTSDLKVVLDSAKDGVLLVKFVRQGEVLKKKVIIH